jgi:hypothetical protein
VRLGLERETPSYSHYPAVEHSECRHGSRICQDSTTSARPAFQLLHQRWTRRQRTHQHRKPRCQDKGILLAFSYESTLLFRSTLFELNQKTIISYTQHENDTPASRGAPLQSCPRPSGFEIGTFGCANTLVDTPGARVVRRTGLGPQRHSKNDGGMPASSGRRRARNRRDRRAAGFAKSAALAAGTLGIVPFPRLLKENSI